MADTTELRQKLVDGANQIMFDAAQDVMLALIDAVPYDTGDLLRSRYINQTADEPRITWTLGFTAPQGEWTEFGVEPHQIGEIGQVMAWVDKTAGLLIRRYTGWEVSTPARPWFFPTIQEMWPGVLEANLGAAGWN